MKKILLLGTAALICLATVTASADEASVPVPIHRTHAKHRVIKPAKPSPKPAKTMVKPVTSSAQ